MSHRKAIDEILRNAGGQFDPAVVRVFTEAERQGLIDEEQHNGHRRGSRRPVLEPREETVPAAREESVPAGGE